MQILKPINVGQAPNDQTGDTLRNAMVLVNENFTKTRSGVDAVEIAAAAAQRKADAAIPAAEKGAAGGVTPLDAAGKVPAAHLPEPAIPLAQKAAPGGVAPLDEGSRVPVDFMPITEPAVPLAQKGQPYGVATLAVDGKIDPSQLPALIPVAEKGRANGVAMLGADGRVPAVQLPAVQDAVPLAEKGLPGGVATLGGDGRVPVEQMPPIPMGLPVATMAWWPLRASIPAGQIPADGQTLSRATFPDLAAMVTGGRVPVVPEADWLADPLKRGSYTLGDGVSTIRVPDMNGVASGSLAAMVLRGDGARSAGTPGRLQADQLGPMDYRVVSGFNQATNLLADGALNAVMPSGNFVGYTFTTTRQTTSGNRWIANTGDETRMANATGVWTIHAFAAVTNPGAVDTAQLASDFAALNAAFQSLKGQTLGFGQALQDMQGQRAFGPTYVNAAGRPICVYVLGSTASSAGGNMYLTINSVPATRVIATGNGVTLAMNSVVPSGASYAVVSDNMNFGSWREYR
ncbi:phage tail protein [Achromobacter sp. NCFB-sbj8-Ac1-l]|uniref:phage tail protein n=1 Tax=unclassified Achromobacter TaxID=2626865 RepID=UPI004046A2D7